MEIYQLRVISEKSALDKSLEKLNEFMGKSSFLMVPREERRRLIRQ
jgi:hypothetical protein